MSDKYVKINKWLTMLWQMNKDEGNENINQLRSFLFEQRDRIRGDYKRYIGGNDE